MQYFLDGNAPIIGEGSPIYYFANFLLKTALNWKKFGSEIVCPECPTSSAIGIWYVIVFSINYPQYVNCHLEHVVLMSRITVTVKLIGWTFICFFTWSSTLEAERVYRGDLTAQARVIWSNRLLSGNHTGSGGQSAFPVVWFSLSTRRDSASISINTSLIPRQ